MDRMLDRDGWLQAVSQWMKMRIFTVRRAVGRACLALLEDRDTHWVERKMLEPFSR